MSFRDASVHELVCILQFVDTKNMGSADLDFMIRWVTESTYRPIAAQLVINYLRELEDR